MSRWRPEPLALGLDAHTLACAGVALAPAPGGAGAPPPWDEARLRAAMAAARPGTTAAGTAELLVCADLCQHFVQQAPAGLRSLAELQQLAAARAAMLYGGVAADWTVVADWRLLQPMLCAALPTPLLRAVQAAAIGLGLRLAVESALLRALQRLATTGLGQGWSADRQAPGQGDGTLAWATPASVVLVSTRQQRLHSLRCLRRPPALPPAALAALVQHEAVQDSLRTGAQPGPIALAWTGAGPLPQAGTAATRPPWPVAWFDARAALPAEPAAAAADGSAAAGPDAAGSDAVWASRLRNPDGLASPYRQA